jgi:16S rRNA (cytosine967-C5)-methyltransferase
MINNLTVKLFENLIKEIFKFSLPIDKLIADFFKQNRKLSQEERKICVDTVYVLIRNFYKITSVVDKNNIPHQIGLTWIKILKLPLAKIKGANKIDFHSLNNLNFANNINTNTELPTWIIDKLKREYSQEEILSLAETFKEQAPLDLRVNTLKATRENIYQELNSQNLYPQLMKYSPFGIRINAKISLKTNPLFKNGLVEIQDESSQIAGLLLGPKRGEMIVDFCSGSGGKALLFGMLMHNSGRIYTLDNNERRLNNLTPRLARSGLSNIFPKLIQDEHDVKVKRLYGKINKVFVDAPCSGLGTLRRNPELKLRMSPKAIEELNKKQSSILNIASKLTQKGGLLVYATCSILKEENEDIVNNFLTQNPNFKLISPNNILELLPHKHNTDGFFAALLKHD